VAPIYGLLTAGALLILGVAAQRALEKWKLSRELHRRAKVIAAETASMHEHHERVAVASEREWEKRRSLQDPANPLMPTAHETDRHPQSGRGPRLGLAEPSDDLRERPGAGWRPS
jgi:hypothetical protein